MPTTKSEELHNSISDLKSLMTSCNSKIDHLTNTTNTLQQQVVKVERDISDRIDKLDDSLKHEISVLKNADLQIQNQLDDFKRVVSTDVANIKSDASEDRALLLKTNQTLDGCYEVIKTQKKRIVSLERECFRGMQHSRGFNIEIDGIPTDVGDDPLDLENAVLELLRCIDVHIEDYEVDTVHRLPSKQVPKATIVRFVTRKTVRACHRNSHKLKNLSDLNLDIDGLTEDSRIYIRPSQCSYIKNLAYNCRQLKRQKLIKKVNTAKDGRITIEKNDGSFLKVTHMEDLTKDFPNFTKFNFEYDEHKKEEKEENN